MYSKPRLVMLLIYKGNRADTFPLWKAEFLSTAIFEGFASLKKNIHAWHSFFILNAQLCLVTRCKKVVEWFQEISRNR